jgi:histidinol-phosphatase (PHP family)
MLALCEAYFAGYEQLAKMKLDIVGHIDLISKFNRGGMLFDECDERYLAAARRAVDALIPTGAYFEINTGVIPRGYRDIPYPAPAILEYIRSKGGKFILSGDTHRAENLCYGFDEWGKLI